MDKPAAFNSLHDAFRAASYLDTLRHAEHQWVQSRLSWLFISQSFCITSYVVVSIAATERDLNPRWLLVLKLGLPAFGVASCALVGAAAWAAARVARRLAVERRSAVRHINENSPLNIPEDGPDGVPLIGAWTYWAGEMPHRVLPWVLAAFWLLQFLG
jgi:hypothetical protein